MKQNCPVQTRAGKSEHSWIHSHEWVNLAALPEKTEQSRRMNAAQFHCETTSVRNSPNFDALTDFWYTPTPMGIVKAF